MFQDLRHAIRAAARARGTTTVLVLSLALGTGVNAAVFGVLDRLLLRAPAGVERPSSLVDIYTSEFSGAPYGQSSYPDYLSVRSTAVPFLSIAAVDDTTVANVRLGERAQAVRISAVSEDFFVVLAMSPRAGRFWTSAAAPPDVPQAVLSFPLAEHLGGAVDVLGRTLTIADRPYVIVGVTPARFRGLRAGRECDVWIPMSPPPSGRGDRRLSIVARLAPGVTREAAEAGLGQLSAGLAERYPATNRGRIEDAEAPRLITPVRYSYVDPAVRMEHVLIGIVVVGASVLLLVSACLNVGSLLLSRAAARRHELAIKMALGATRRRLFRQLLTETLGLSLAAGGLGLLFAIWTVRTVPALFMVEQAEQLDTRLDPTAVLLTLGVACLAGALFGVAPALHGAASPPAWALRSDAGGISERPRGARLRSLLVGAQIALSTLLILGTGLLMTSITHALEGDRASAVKRVAVVSIELPGRFGDPARGVASRSALITGVASLTGVDAAGWASTLPLDRGNRRQFRIEGEATAAVDTVDLDSNVVSAGYFAAMALPCIEGRDFDDGDTMLAPPVVIVDELLARRYLGTTAVGRHLIDEEGTRAEIIGVVRSGRYRTLQQPPQPTVYYPSTQDYLWRGHLVVRMAGDPAAVLPDIIRTVNRVGDGAAILRNPSGRGELRAATLDRRLSESLTLDRLTTTLVGVCGVMALAMAGIGVAGVMSDAVQRRTREIGLRVALGARRSQVVRLVLGEAVYLAAAGLLTGGVAALAAAHVARLFFNGLPSVAIGTLGAAAGALALIVALAACVPLRRALRVSPTIALRAE